MSHITKQEYLSAFVDGEAGSFEQHRLCDQLQSDAEMRDKLSSYSLIGEAMRNRAQSEALTADASFLSGITAALDNEEPLNVALDQVESINPEQAKTRKRGAFNKPVLGYAVAASVAAVAAISFQNYVNTPQKTVTTASNASTKQSDVLMSGMLPTAQVARVSSKPNNDDFLIGATYKAPDAKTRGLMNKYVAHHLQYASSSTLMPRVRAVSYSTDF